MRFFKEIIFLTILFSSLALLYGCSGGGGGSGGDGGSLTYWKIIGVTTGMGDVNDVFLSNNTAYIANGRDDLHIFDLNDLTNPQKVGVIDSFHYSDYYNFYGVHVEGNIAYVLVDPGCPGWCMPHWSTALYYYDISDQSNPIFLKNTFLILNMEIHDFLVEGDLVYVTGWNTSSSLRSELAIINVSDLFNPYVESTIVLHSPGTLEKHENIVYVSDRSSFVGNFFMEIDVTNPSIPNVLTSSLGDTVTNYSALPFKLYEQVGYFIPMIGIFPQEANEVHVYDLKDPLNIHLIKIILTESIANHVEIYDSYLYVSTGTGLEIFDISKPDDPLFVDKIPTDFPAKLSRVNDGLGVVVTEDEKIQIFQVP